MKGERKADGCHFILHPSVFILSSSQTTAARPDLF